MTKQNKTFIAFRRTTPLLLLVAFFIPASLSRPASSQTSLGWRVWIKTSPCSGRFDWLSVAQHNPTGGGNNFVPYETVLWNQGCTQPAPNGCTFAKAQALMASLRGHPKFLDYCCRDYSVWQNTQTKKYSVVQGKFGNAGFGWQFVKGQLCCEEAEALAGMVQSTKVTDKR